MKPTIPLVDAMEGKDMDLFGHISVFWIISIMKCRINHYGRKVHSPEDYSPQSVDRLRLKEKGLKVHSFN